MKLIRCHIDNFGKLHNVDIEFNDCNNFYAENGSGKSTLAAFIKVMFYGFSGLGKKTDENLYNEKVRYTPWQGGSYGGTLEFEAAGKCYTIIRHFDASVRKNTRTDSYELRDSKTNLPTNDYENLGVELFGVGPESFARTVFVGQGDCDTAMNGEISAMIGNIVEDSSDINNYETADAILKARTDNLNPGKKTGELYKLKDRITGLSAETSREKDVEDRLNKLIENRKRAELARDNCKADKERLQTEYEKAANNKERMYAVQTYENACSTYRDKEEEYEICKNRFRGVVPSEEELNKALSKASFLRNKKDELDRRKFELESLMRKNENENPKKTGVAYIFLILALMLLAVGISNLFFTDAFKKISNMLPFNISVVAFIVGFVLLALYIGASRKQRNINKIREYENNQLENERKDYEAGRAKYTDEKSKLDERLKALGVEGDPFTEIPRIVSNLHEFESAKRDKERAKRRVEELEQKEEYKKYISELTKKERTYDSDAGSVCDDEKEDVSAILKRIKDTETKTEELTNNIINYDRQIEEAENQIDELSQKEEELADLSEAFERKKEKYDNLLIARELLAKAKENLGAKYVNPMQEAFVRYYSMIDAEEDSKTEDDYGFIVDANGNLGKYEYGLIRDIRQFSFGNRDLINFCMRLAMIESMYEREKPMLILDDPFVNLDTGRYKRALEFLKTLAKEYQIIYFTCRN